MEAQDLKRRVRELYEQVSFSQEETRRLQMIEDAITKGAIEKACVLSMILATSTHKKPNAAARLRDTLRRAKYGQKQQTAQEVSAEAREV